MTRSVLHYLQTHEYMTSMDAYRDLHCTRLAPRVWELIHLHGYSVDSELVTREGSRFSVYRLVTQPVQLQAFG